MRKVKFLLGLVLTMLAANVVAQSDGTYYLYNEESGLFYSRASYWGTAAVGDNYGFPVNLAFTDGISKISGADWTDRGLGVDLYYDQEALNWKFTPSNDGYIISDDGGQLKVNGEKVQFSRESEGSVWKLLTGAEYEAKIADRDKAAQKQAMISASVGSLKHVILTDVTDKVQNAALINSLDGWTKEFGRGNNLTCNNLVTESYESTGKLTQKVTGLAKGLYKVTVNAFFRNGWNNDCVAREATGYVYSTSYLKGNGNFARIKTWASERVSDTNPNSMAEASEAIAQGKYLNEVYCYVGDNGELDIEIGWPSFNYAGWFICKNLKLYQCTLDPDAPLAGTPVADGLYYIRMNCDAYDLAKPYIIDPASGSNMNLSESNETNAVWRIITFNATDGNAQNGKKYHIQNVATGKYWVEGPTAPLGGTARFYNIYWNEDQEAFNFSGRSDGNIGNAGYICANSATSFGRNSSSAYCNWELIAVPTANVTLNYIYNGKTAKTEVVQVVKGKTLTLPAAPFKCKFSAELPETINEDCTIDVTVTASEDFPFAFSENFDNAKWYTWKMRSGYAGFNGTTFPETASDTQPADAKNMFAFVGNPFAFKVLTPMDKYLYLKGNNNEIATVTEEGASLYLYGMNDTEYTFAIDGVTGTVNDVQKSVGFWAAGASYSDGGSKIYLDEAKDVQIYKVAFGADCPAGAAVAINGVTVTPSDAVPAFVLKSAPAAEDIVPAEVKYFKTEVTVTGKTINVNYITNMPSEWVALGKLVEQAKAITLPTENFGTDPGFYNKAAVDAFPAAIAAAEAASQNYELEAQDYANACTALAAAIAAIQPIMPEVGKTYMFINAFPTFEAQQGHKKAMYNDGTALRWKQMDETDKSFYWTVTGVDGNNVTFKNYKDGKYPKGYTTANQPIPVQEEENYCLLTSLGQGQFGIKSNGSSAAFHAGNHGGGSGKNGNVMVWDAGANSCSAWFIHETTSVMDLVDALDQVATEAKAANASANELVTASAPKYYEVTTSTDQFSSNRPCPSEGSIDNLLDGDGTTFFHSDWSGSFPSGPYHELYVDGLDAATTLYNLSAMRRINNGSLCANDNVLQMEVYGGTVEKPENRDSEGAVFTITSGEYPLAVIDLPLNGFNADATFNIGDTGYEALCFKVTKTNSWSDSRAYFHFGEFHLYDAQRIVPIDVNIPQAYRNRLIAKIDALNALLAAPVLSEEYGQKVQAAKAAVEEAREAALGAVNANATFAGSNSKAKVQITAGIKGSKGRVAVALPEDEIVASLGIQHFDEAKQLTIDAAAGFKHNVPAKYVADTYFRNAKGNVCEKADAVLQLQPYAGKLNITPLAELEATTPTINIYTVYTANEKAYLFLVQVDVVAADGDGATAINGVNANVEASGLIYDLQGRPVSSVKKGQIYIVGGKKVMF